MGRKLSVPLIIADSLLNKKPMNYKQITEYICENYREVSISEVRHSVRFMMNSENAEVVRTGTRSKPYFVFKGFTRSYLVNAVKQCDKEHRLPWMAEYSGKQEIDEYKVAKLARFVDYQLKKVRGDRWEAIINSHMRQRNNMTSGNQNYQSL